MSMKPCAPFGCASHRGCHTVLSVRCARIWMRPSAIAPRSRRTTVKAAMSGPVTVSTGRWNCTSGRIAKPARSAARCAPSASVTENAARCTPAWPDSAASNSMPERRVGGLEQHLHIAAAEHAGDVAGAGRRAVGVDLHRHRRRRKARAGERAARRLRIADEMADMVEKDLIRRPAAGGRLLLPMQRFSATPAPSCRGCFPAGSVSIWRSGIRTRNEEWA